MNRQAADDQSKLVELSDKELDSVAGGEIHITKTIDQASPVTPQTDRSELSGLKVFPGAANEHGLRQGS